MYVRMYRQTSIPQNECLTDATQRKFRLNTDPSIDVSARPSRSFGTYIVLEQDR